MRFVLFVVRGVRPIVGVRAIEGEDVVAYRNGRRGCWRSPNGAPLEPLASREFEKRFLDFQAEQETARRTARRKP